MLTESLTCSIGVLCVCAGFSMVLELLVSGLGVVGVFQCTRTTRTVVSGCQIFQ